MTHEPNTAPEIDSWQTEATSESTAPAKSGGSFFTFWRCCGCLAVLGVVVMIGAGIAIKLGIDGAFEVSPLEMPTVERSKLETESIIARFKVASGEPIELTPDELTVIVNHALQSEDATVGELSKFYCGSTPEGLLELMLTIQTPEGGPFFIPAGRFMNVHLIGIVEINQGEVVAAELATFRFGSLYNKSDFTPESSVAFLENIEKQRNVDPGLRDALGRIDVFKFDGEKILMRFNPESGTSSAEDAPEDADETSESAGEANPPSDSAGETPGDEPAPAAPTKPGGG